MLECSNLKMTSQQWPFSPQEECIARWNVETNRPATGIASQEELLDLDFFWLIKSFPKNEKAEMQIKKLGSQ
jgi:hypothetical protein